MRKKIISCLLILMILVSCTACGNSTDASEGNASEGSLNDAVVLIKEVEELVGGIVRGQWFLYTGFVAEEDSFAQWNKDRVNEATKKLEDADKLITGTGGFYSAVKKYHSTVYDFLSLASDYVDAYWDDSKWTRLSDMPSEDDCEAAFNDLAAYIDMDEFDIDEIGTW